MVLFRGACFGILVISHVALQTACMQRVACHDKITVKQKYRLFKKERNFVLKKRWTRHSKNHNNQAFASQAFIYLTFK